jgi:hypothetical protein
MGRIRPNAEIDCNDPSFLFSRGSMPLIGNVPPPQQNRSVVIARMKRSHFAR